jgi:glutaredoxin
VLSFYSKLVCTLIFLLAALPLPAEIYKWIDADGTAQYSDKPPENPQLNLEITGRISSYESPEILPADVSAAKTRKTKPARNPRVVMYSTEWCGVCKRAKQYFDAKNIAYTEYDIDKDVAAKTDFDRMGGRGVPVILVGERRINGFSAGGFEQLYYGK